MPPAPSPTRQLSEFIATTHASDVAPRLMERAKDLLVDHLGVAYCGLDLPWSRMMRARAMADGGPSESTIYGMGKVAARNAALANATVAHAIELDDTHIPSRSHISAVVFPAALAIAESQGAAGRDFLTAYIVGCEAMGRIGRTAAATLTKAGFHPTSTNGVFGATAAAASLLKLDADHIETAFGLALSMASGTMPFEQGTEGTMGKRLYSGLPAEHGILAALLAAQGFSGPRNAIEGERGFLKVFAGSDCAADMLAGLGDTFIVEEMSIKLNACSLHFASLIDALTLCRTNREGFAAADIERIDVFGPKTLLGGHMEYRPGSVMAAQFSLPYIVAATLLLDPRDPASFEDAARMRPDVVALADRVTAAEDPELETLFPAKFAASARLCFKGSRTIEHCVTDARGTAARPLSRADIRDKFRAINKATMPIAFQEEMLAAIGDVDAPGGLVRLTALLGIKTANV